MGAENSASRQLRRPHGMTPGLAYNPVELIRRKRDGKTLLPDELGRFILDYTAGRIPDYQASALLMAIYFSGLSEPELLALTDAMLRSGETIDLSDIPGLKVDKHSTGGVGDKVSLHLAPVVAACGVRVPMISGRGLGHSGGTLDKLESIPGFVTRLSVEEFRTVLRRTGLSLIGQTDSLVPADRLLYALRDVTATVESIPLIAASIMSKKLAEGIDGLVLDVKVGSGAFMKTREEAYQLGRDAGRHRPPGRQAGHRVSHQHGSAARAVDRQRRRGPRVGRGAARRRPRRPGTELTRVLGAEMLRLGGAGDQTGRPTRSPASTA